MEEKKISIVMTFFERHEQLKQTIISISKTNYTNYNIIIVDDCSETDININELHLLLDKKNNIEIIKINKEHKTWTNPVAVYNIGIHVALEYNPDIIILQNSECYHYGDILSYTNNNLIGGNYISYSCLAISKETWENCLYNFEGYLGKKISNINNDNDNYHYNNDGCYWYNHPIQRPVGYDFCSAIYTKDLIELNGYDERFYDRLFFGDDDLKMRIERYGLNITIPEPINNPFVVHQHHDHNYISVNDRSSLFKCGDTLYNDIKKYRTYNYRANHIITDDFDYVINKKI